MPPTLIVRTVTSMPFEENTYLIWMPGRTNAVVVDPGLEPEAIFEALRDEGLRPVVILNTHGHADHIAGNEAMKAVFPAAPLIVGANETPLLADAELNLSAAFGLPIVSPPPDRTVGEGDAVEAAGMVFEVLDLPGHSPGHVVFVVRGEPCYVFGGDVLFRGGIGRTDFPGGDMKQLLDGIRAKLFTLPP
jgi:glyoxylase-like metal-dependent hydrolase (beta-lactamase superfamily II)